MAAKELEHEELWWFGPKFLKDEKSSWPENKVEKFDESLNEVKKAKQEDCLVTFQAMVQQSWRLSPKRFSNWLRLLSILAWIYRFVSNCKGEKLHGSLNQDEIKDSEHKLICQAQHDVFRSEIADIHRKTNLSVKSKLVGLNPKIDQDGILRVNTRLVNAEFLPYATRYPIILPSNNHITFLIIMNSEITVEQMMYCQLYLQNTGSYMHEKRFVRLKELVWNVIVKRLKLQSKLWHHFQI